VRLLPIGLLALLALMGCAATPRATGPVARPDPATLQNWSASGRLALAADGEGGSGAFIWEQREETTRLDLRGPLGVGALQVVASPAGLSVADAAGRSVDTEAARAELQARLGADLPWISLRYWMLGLPAPGETAAVADAGAAPWRTIEQSGWRIGYDAFTTEAGLSLPQRFTASRGAVRVRVVVDAWTLPPGEPGP